jgi:hypothetical protein
MRKNIISFIAKVFGIKVYFSTSELFTDRPLIVQHRVTEFEEFVLSRDFCNHNEAHAWAGVVTDEQKRDEFFKTGKTLVTTLGTMFPDLIQKHTIGDTERWMMSVWVPKDKLNN